MSGPKYDGQVVRRCEPRPYDFGDVDVVVVSGDGPNICGHLILRVGAYYFHANRFHSEPLRMDAPGYCRYLAEHGKRELRRTHVSLPNPQGAYLQLEAIISRPWLWLVVPHNCATFVEDVLRAGGCPDYLISNCPALEHWGPRSKAGRVSR